MSQIVFTAWVEIPVKVYAEYQKQEHATMTYPGCPAAIGIDDIEICLDGDENILAVDLQSLKNSILENRNDEFVEDAWDHR